VYLEVYDPTIPDFLPENFRRANVQANLTLYQENKKVFETPAVRANRLNEKRPGTLPVWLQLPVSQLKPGKYDCQVNVIDQFGRKFAFPRTTLAVVPAASAAPPSKS
jgi:hypothetical protein